MGRKISKLEAARRKGSTQVDAQRISILDAAEKLFLEKGLENTSMSDIAAQAGITRVSLYRYFPNRDPIAFEISVRMLNTIIKVSAQSKDEGTTVMDTIKILCINMIRNFPALRSAYRYIGMFDHLYGNHYPSAELASWYKEHIFSLTANGASPLLGYDLDENTKTRVVTLMNMIMSFLEKMAARGELMAEEQEVPLQMQLEAFEEIVIVYLKSLEGELNERE